MTSVIESKFVQVSTAVVSTAGVVGDLISQSPAREMLPDFYQEHGGNFGIPWLFVVATNIIGRLIEARGTKDGNQLVAEIGNKFRTWGTVLIIGINIGVESQFINNIKLLQENSRDFMVGAAAITLGWIVGTSVGKWAGKNIH